MKKIGIDARVLDRKMTGTGRYLKNLLDGIPKVDFNNKYYVFINDYSLIDLNFYNPVKVKKSLLPDKIDSFYWLNFILPGEVKKLDLDIFFTCNILLPFFNLPKTKKITVVHDVIQKAVGSFYPLSYRLYLNTLLPLTFRSADIVLTASFYSRSDIIKFYDYAQKKIEVLYTSADRKFKPRVLSEDEKMRLKRKYKLPEKFLLYVGVIEKRKNIDGLFEIADNLFNKGFDLPIVLVGRAGFGYSDIGERSKRSGGKIIYIDYIEDDDLPFIYNLASIFLFPSFYEGFGIPPLEAMQSGIPVISSNLTSLPEVLGEAAIKVSPMDINKIVDEIIRLNKNVEYYKSWQNKGLEKAKEYSYIKSAKKLVEIFDKLKS